MKILLRHKVIGLALCSALLPALAIVFLIYLKEQYSSHRVEKSLESVLDANFSQMVKEIHAICTVSNDIVLEDVGYGLKVVDRVLADKGIFVLGPEKKEWSVKDPYSGEPKNIVMPVLKLGDFSLETMSSSMINELSNLVGGTCSVFQRLSNDDMLLIAVAESGVENPAFKPALIPSIDSDGGANAMIQTVLQGKDYVGPIYYSQKWYLAGCRPIYDSNNEIIGYGFHWEAARCYYWFACKNWPNANR